MSGMEERLPHRPPALLTERILESGPDAAVVRCRIPSDNPFLRARADGRLSAPALILLEMAAQAAAALRPGGAPASGLVVSFEDAQLTAEDVEAETPILARVRAGRVAPPLRYCSYELAREEDGAVLLTGTLAVHG